MLKFLGSGAALFSLAVFFGGSLQASSCAYEKESGFPVEDSQTGGIFEGVKPLGSLKQKVQGFVDLFHEKTKDMHPVAKWLCVASLACLGLIVLPFVLLALLLVIFGLIVISCKAAVMAGFILPLLALGGSLFGVYWLVENREAVKGFFQNLSARLQQRFFAA